MLSRRISVMVILVVVLALGAGGLVVATPSSDSNSNAPAGVPPELEGLGITVETPVSPPAISRERAIEAARQALGDFADQADSITARYVLYTDQGTPTFKGKVMRDFPAWLVTFNGVKIQRQGGKVVPGKLVESKFFTTSVVVVDAETGEWLFQISRGH